MKKMYINPVVVQTEILSCSSLLTGSIVVNNTDPVTGGTYEDPTVVD